MTLVEGHGDYVMDAVGPRVVPSVAEIRERFSIPRTSAWRQARRLEKLGFVKISKLGTQNQVELVKGDFDGRL